MIQSKKWSRLVSGVMAVGFVAVGSLQYTDYVLAAEEAGNAELLYVEEAMQYYIFSKEHLTINDIELSRSMKYYDFKNMKSCGNIYVAYHNGDVIGTLNLNKIDGQYVSTFSWNAPSCIQTACDTVTDVAFGFYDGTPIMYDGSDFYSTETDEQIDLISTKNQSFELSELDTDDVILSRIDAVYYGNSFDSGISTMSNVTFDYGIEVEPVSNEMIDGSGVCWAASIAAKYNFVHDYWEGDVGYCSASDVYYKVKEITGEKPSGIKYYIKKGLEAFELPSNCAYSTLNITEVFTELYHNNPIIISISRQTASGGRANHSVIISGATYTDNDHAVYTIVDPNYSHVQSAYVINARESGDNFTYVCTSYGYTYTEWFRTFSYTAYFNDGKDL